MKVKEQLKLQQNIDVPHGVWTIFGDQCKEIRMMGDQACFGEDYASLEQLRAAIDWYAEQLGGQVKWSKK